ncbi:MAG: TRAP transporter large permease subunit [Bacillota bacterium]|nr:TRAP transporter large permease subunit [Bacillota bacterium]
MFELFVLIILLLFFIFIGVPVAFSLGITAVIGISVFLSPAQLSQMVNISYSHGTSFTLMVAPLFILMSEFISGGGISKDIFSVLSRWFKRLPGGLAISNVFACTVFAALCGSSPVTAVTIGKISIPEMIKNGYDRSFSIGSTVAGGNIGILIPPSLSLIIFGIITETSISRLFMAGIVPGLLLAVALSIYIYIRVKLNPSLGGLSTNKILSDKVSPEASVSTEKLASLLRDLAVIWPIFMLIIVVLGSMYLGYVTPTEAAGVGAFGAFLIVFTMKRLTWSIFINVLRETSKTTAMLMFMIIFGLVFAYLVSSLGIPREVSNALVSIEASRWVILSVVLLFWMAAGCFLDPTGMIVISMPILFPPLVELGFEPIWIGIISTLTICIGMITPPVGLNLYVVKGITNSSFEEVVSGSLPFLLVILIVLLLLVLFPQIVMFVPNSM